MCVGEEKECIPFGDGSSRMVRWGWGGMREGEGGRGGGGVRGATAGGAAQARDGRRRRAGAAPVPASYLVSSV